MKPARLRKSATDAREESRVMGNYVALFTSFADAIAFEKAVLATASVHLPPCARLVKDGAPPTALYWRWLAITAEVWS